MAQFAVVSEARSSVPSIESFKAFVGVEPTTGGDVHCASVDEDIGEIADLNEVTIHIQDSRNGGVLSSPVAESAAFRKLLKVGRLSS